MKNAILLVCITVSLTVFSQDYIRIEPVNYEGFIQEETPAFKVEVDRVKRDVFMEHWEEYLEDNSDLDILKSDHLLTIQKAILESISTYPMNIYMYFEDMEDGSRVFIGFQDTVSGFIAMDNADYGLGLTQLIKRETKKVFVDTKKEDMKMEEKHLDVLEDNLADVKKEEDKVNKKIISRQRDIEKLQNEIEINKSVLVQVREEIGKKRADISSMPTGTSEEMRDAARKELKSKEKEADKVSKTIDKDSRKIYDYESDIRDYEYELEKLKQDEQFAQQKVMEQREIINDLREEMYNLER